MTNIYFFWKGENAPPNPYYLLSRTNKYVRLSSTLSDHLTTTGSSSHTHSVSGFTCGGVNNGKADADYYGVSTKAINGHNHGAPSSYTIGSANNAPAYKGLDLIYVDFTTWLTNLRNLPRYAVVPSTTALQEDSTFARYSDIDNYYIMNAQPGTSGGSNSDHVHSVSGTMQNTDAYRDSEGTTGWSSRRANHSHTISGNSDGGSSVPATMTTRFYEATSDTIRLQAGSVVFADGSYSDIFSLLSSWAGKNLKAGNSNPTASGSDTHTHSGSGVSSGYTALGTAYYVGPNPPQWVVDGNTHTHNWSISLAASSVVPPSVYLIPLELTVTIWKPATGRPKIIGLTH